jgi:PAS domain S-box-containing protein
MQQIAKIQESIKVLQETSLQLARQSRLLDQVHDAIFVFDSDDFVTYWNPAAAERYGWSDGEALGKQTHSLLHTVFPEPLKDIQATLLRTGKWEGELKHLTKDGTRIVVASRWSLERDEDGNPTGTLEINSDITEQVALRKEEEVLRKQEEVSKTRLVESEERLAGIIASAMDGIITVDERQRIVLFNAAAENMFGYTCSEIVGESLDRLIPARFHAAHVRHITQFSQSHVTRRRMDGAIEGLYGLRSNGEEFPIEASISHVTTNGVQLFTAIVRDISERQLNMQLQLDNLRLEERTRQTEQANRIKDQFLANMSHELRTPLNGIIGFAQFLADGKPGRLNPKQSEYLGDILHSGQHMLQIVTDILDLTKVNAGKMELRPETFALVKAIEEGCAVTQPIADKNGVHIDINVSPKIGEVKLDRHRFMQVLYNLLSNAIKFTNDRGTVEVTAELCESNDFQLVVNDNGIGIQAENIDRIFEEFEQVDSGATSRQHEGTGLGLALSKKLVQLQGGELSVTSILGKGSSFTVKLPLVSSLDRQKVT